jgi:hypothetical protein
MRRREFITLIAALERNPEVSSDQFISLAILQESLRF